MKQNLNPDVPSRIKDGIRDNNISDILFVLHSVLQNPMIFEPEIPNDALEVVAQLIDWNSLSHFENFLAFFKEYLKKSEFRSSSMECYRAIVHKGMSHEEKIQLIT